MNYLCVNENKFIEVNFFNRKAFIKILIRNGILRGKGQTRTFPLVRTLMNIKMVNGQATCAVYYREGRNLPNSCPGAKNIRTDSVSVLSPAL